MAAKWETKHVMPHYSERMHSAVFRGDVAAMRTLMSEMRGAGDGCLIRPLINHHNPTPYPMPPLTEAAALGHLNVVQFLAKDCAANIEERDEQPESHAMAIHMAAKHGQLEILKYFLDEWPDLLEAVDKNGNTPLCYAAFANQLETVKYLVIEKDANINVQGVFGRTPLYQAADRGHLDVVRFLVETRKAYVMIRDNGSNEATAIHLAASMGHRDVVEYLLSVWPDLLELGDKTNSSPLCYASYAGQLPVVELLVTEKHANVERRGGLYGRTPLMMAGDRGHLEVVRFLVETARANLEAGDTALNDTVVHLAARNGHRDVVDYLVNQCNKSELTKAKNKSGTTPLGYAIRQNQTEVVELLQTDETTVSN